MAEALKLVFFWVMCMEFLAWVSYGLLTLVICGADGARPTLEKPKICMNLTRDKIEAHLKSGLARDSD